MNEIKKWLSFLWPLTLKRWNSKYSGQVELILINGKKVLNTQHANYSFDSLHSVFQYALRNFMPKVKPEDRLLLLGLGGGSVPFILRNELKISNPLTAIEIDSLMIQIAREEFGIFDLNNITIIEADAANYVKLCNDSYTCIFVDIFIDDKVPEFVYTLDFLKNLKRLLNPHGRIFINTILRTSKHTQLASSMHEALKQLGFEIQIKQVVQQNFVWIVDWNKE